MATWMLVNIGSGDSLLPHGSKSLPEPLVYHQCGCVSFWSTCEQKKCWRYQFVEFGNYILKILPHLPCRDRIKDELKWLFSEWYRDQNHEVSNFKCWSSWQLVHLANHIIPKLATRVNSQPMYISREECRRSKFRGIVPEKWPPPLFANSHFPLKKYHFFFAKMGTGMVYTLVGSRGPGCRQHYISWQTVSERCLILRFNEVISQQDWCFEI